MKKLMIIVFSLIVLTEVNVISMVKDQNYPYFEEEREQRKLSNELNDLIRVKEAEKKEMTKDFYAKAKATEPVIIAIPNDIDYFYEENETFAFLQITNEAVKVLLFPYLVQDAGKHEKRITALTTFLNGSLSKKTLANTKSPYHELHVIHLAEKETSSAFVCELLKAGAEGYWEILEKAKNKKGVLPDAYFHFNIWEIIKRQETRPECKPTK